MRSPGAALEKGKWICARRECYPDMAKEVNYESEAERLARLARQATTPRLRQLLLEKAEACRRMGEGGRWNLSKQQHVALFANRE
jgi:hypothetical protein